MTKKRHEVMLVVLGQIHVINADKCNDEHLSAFYDFIHLNIFSFPIITGYQFRYFGIDYALASHSISLLSYCI